MQESQNIPPESTPPIHNQHQPELPKQETVKKEPTSADRAGTIVTTALINLVTKCVREKTISAKALKLQRGPQAKGLLMKLGCFPKQLLPVFRRPDFHVDIFGIHKGSLRLQIRWGIPEAETLEILKDWDPTGILFEKANEQR